MNPNEIVRKLDEAKAYLRSRVPEFPKISITLGSGLATLLDQLELEAEIPYETIPHFRDVTVVGHVGKLLVGKLGGTRIACMKGRLHFYEGLPMSEVVFPFRALAHSGSEIFIITNAVGGLHADMAPRELLLITDHINLTGTNPLIGPNIEAIGERFPDMTHIYDLELRALVRETAKKLGISLREGVYVGCLGPSYETPAEIRMFRNLGADVVGMSTVPETIALRHMGKRVVGVSFITNLAAGVSLQPLRHEDVLANAQQGHPTFAKLITECVGQMAKLVKNE